MSVQQSVYNVSESRQTERACVATFTAASKVNEMKPTSSAVKTVTQRRVVATRALLNAILVNVDGEDEVGVASVFLYF